MKKKVKLLITVTALAAVLLVTLASCGQLANGDEKEVSVNLPYLSRDARALSDDVNSRLKNEHSSYRVHMNDRVLEGTGGNFSASFAVGLNVEVFVESLNANGEVIVRTVTKSIVVKDGENSVDFDIKQDGEEVIQTRSPSVKYDGGAADAIGVPIDTTTYSSGSAVPLSAQEPTRPGFIFMGWISNVDLTGTNDSGSKKINQGIPFAKVGTSVQGIDFPINTFEMPDSPVTLTAKWEVNYKYDKADWEVGDVVILGSQLDSLMAIHPNAVTEATVVYALKYHVAVVYKNDAAAKKVYIMGKEQKVRVAWCLETANGHNQDIASLQCEPDDPAASGAYTWTQGQDTDGSGNWQKLQAYLAQNGGNDTNTPGNYPAWEYCNDYANVSAELSSSTVLNNDWYLPTIAELFDIWKVKESVSVSLKALGARFMYRYWSSSQDATESTYAWFLDFNTGGNYEVNAKTYNTGKNKVANNADFCVFAVHQLQY